MLKKMIPSLMLAVSFSPFTLAQGDSATVVENLVPVSVVQVHYQSAAKPVVASGMVKPLSEQTLAFKVPGIVTEVQGREGMKVQKGQLLASLQLDEAQAMLAKATAVKDDAQRQLERLTALKENNLASDEQIRQARTRADVAKADWRLAQINRRYVQIKAPSDGIILARHIEPNELVQPGQPGFVFADNEQGWSVSLAVADVDVVKLQLGDKAFVSLDAYPNQRFSGVVKEIAGRADVRSQTFQVDVALKDVPKLYSGLVAHTQISPAVQQSLARLPMSALVQAQGNGAVVYEVDALGNVQPRAITLAYMHDGFVYMKEGVAQGKWLIDQGTAFVNPKGSVTISNKSQMLKETAQLSKTAERDQ